MKEHANINIIGEYISLRNDLEKLCTSVTQLTTNLLKSTDIQIHLIHSRVKDKDSLEKKILNPEKDYQNLSSITDLVGLRIITYFEEDIDKVARVIEEEFNIDYLNSIDKRRTHNSSNFGYLSLHYICQLKENRKKLKEYKLLPNVKFEIQIRSILQHSWAEIEHDLVYKNKLYSTPKLRRSFSRIAGLLEIADNEFTSIKTYLNKVMYEDKSEILKVETIEDLIDRHPIIMEIDKSLVDYFQKIPTVNFEYDSSTYFSHNGLIQRLNNVEIFTELQLLQSLEDHKESIPEIFHAYTEHNILFGFDVPLQYNTQIGYCLFILPYAKILLSSDLETNKMKKLEEFIKGDYYVTNLEAMLKDEQKEDEKRNSKISEHIFNSYLKMFKEKH